MESPLPSLSDAISEYDDTKPLKMVNFPNYSAKILQNLAKVEFNFQGMNSCKFDFINTQLEFSAISMNST